MKEGGRARGDVVAVGRINSVNGATFDSTWTSPRQGRDGDAGRQEGPADNNLAGITHEQSAVTMKARQSQSK